VLGAFGRKEMISFSTSRILRWKTGSSVSRMKLSFISLDYHLQNMV
jgi:hypothetical protein